MKPHTHKRLNTCCCSSQALEPHEDCPIHSCGEWPPRCEICGQFMKLSNKLTDFGGDEYLASEYSDVKTCTKSDLGYHCSCYDTIGECDICGEIK